MTSNHTSRAAAVVISGFLALGGLTACGDDDEGIVDDDVEQDVSDGAEDLGDDLSDGAEDLGDDLSDGAEDLSEEIEEQVDEGAEEESDDGGD